MPSPFELIKYVVDNFKPRANFIESVGLNLQAPKRNDDFNIETVNFRLKLHW